MCFLWTKMLYVFLVDTGTMIQLDMNLALETVGYLKTVIARHRSIPPDKQVRQRERNESKIFLQNGGSQYFSSPTYSRCFLCPEVRV